MWKINEPYRVALSDIKTDIRPAVAAGCLWLPQNNGGVVGITYSGQAYYHSEILGGNIGLKVAYTRGVATGLPSIDAMTSDSAFIYAYSDTSKAFVKWSVNAVSGTATVIGTSPVGANSEIAVIGNKLYYVSNHLIADQTVSQQHLYYIDTTTGMVTQVGFLPGKKQESRRHLAVSNGYLYISSFNTGEVIKFDTVTGGTTNISVNRDVTALEPYGDYLGVISSDKGQVTIGSGAQARTLSSTMVSSIYTAGTPHTVTHVTGIINGGNSVAATYDAQAGSTIVWARNYLGGLQRSTLSTSKIFATAAATGGTAPVTAQGIDPVLGADYAISRTASGFSSLGSIMSFTTSMDMTGIERILLLPAIPGVTAEHIALIKESEVIVFMATSPLYWQNSFEINQFTAVSTGSGSYKQG